MRARAAAVCVLSLVTAAGAGGCGGGGNQELFASTAGGTGGSVVHGAASSSAGTGGTTSASTSATASATASASTAASTSSGGGPYPAPFPTPPQVITFGGPVLASPKIYPVFFAGDDATLVASLTDFTENIGASAYFAAATSEYGVGPGTGGPAIQLTETAPVMIDDSGVQQWLAQEFAAGAPFPTADSNTLVVIYYPAGTTITLDGQTSCQVFGGYHNGAMVGNGQEIAYAVVPRCDNTLDTATGAASHEIVEASTDPYPMDAPAYAQVDDADFLWESLLGGGEVGDMCAQFPNVFTQFPPFDYTVQRIWSNKAVKEGRDPCQPELPGEVYANAAPVLSGMAPVTVMGQSVNVRSFEIPVGQTMSIPVDFFSEGPTPGPFTVKAIDPATMLGAPSPLLSLTMTPSSGENGTVGQLSVKVLQAGPGTVELFFLTTEGPSTQGVWIGAVSN
jgi:hypothetical protein